MNRNRDSQLSVRGFSLLEILVVVAIISIVLGAILAQVNIIQQRATTEEGKVDDFEQARDFMDQIFRDTRQMGYPSIRNIDPTASGWSPAFCTTPFPSCLLKDSRMAVGLIKLAPSELDFEGDVNGAGTVSIVSYKINGSGTCANCIQRAQISKASGSDGLAQVNAIAASSYSVEVQNVQNPTTIFTAYDASGNAVTIGTGIDMDNNSTTIPTVRTIQAMLKIASPSAVDPKTGMQLEADIEGRVQVVNCSMASTGLASADGLQLTCQ